ncbi:hypothetical protein P872_18475 [Rhodonellum psychrophilum GCM71 = DSM 17998]|uniref:Uncharacterized protein n=2 Tax=Rhodonellum TaxID=336827 RepID=U5C2J7_9BACT|nr:hypothetical protein P872_18475 [Rhodonellum psychrophilum GCM71 = DSM 17998]SDZ35591.1 hypothetical protein SAMN05444412_11151 [Rhodonellum ikkaensis]
MEKIYKYYCFIKKYLFEILKYIGIVDSIIDKIKDKKKDKNS